LGLGPSLASGSSDEPRWPPRQPSRAHETRRRPRGRDRTPYGHCDQDTHHGPRTRRSHTSHTHGL